MFELANRQNAVNERLFMEWINILLSIGELSKAKQISERAVNQFPCVSLLKLQFQVEILQYTQESKYNSDKAKQTLQNHLSELLAKLLSITSNHFECWDVWILLKNYFSLSNSNFSIVMKYYKVTLT